MKMEERKQGRRWMQCEEREGLGYLYGGKNGEAKHVMGAAFCFELLEWGISSPAFQRRPTRANGSKRHNKKRIYESCKRLIGL